MATLSKNENQTQACKEVPPMHPKVEKHQKAVLPSRESMFNVELTVRGYAVL
jgi:hypothetical protein